LFNLLALKRNCRCSVQSPISCWASPPHDRKISISRKSVSARWSFIWFSFITSDSVRNDSWDKPQALDAILVIIIGSISSRAVSGTAPFFASLAAAFSLIAVHWVLSYFTESWPALSYLAKGRDTVLIRQGHINRMALRDAHMSEDDLAEDLRQNGITSPRQVKEARLERNG
jgi:hypothetical protein